MIRFARLLTITTFIAFTGCASQPAPGPVCGDGVCEAGETPETCSEDCKPAVSCGDGTCNGTETTATCPKDCPETATCGDGICNGTETTATCPRDCPAQMTCGDGTCAADETVTSCPLDCGGLIVSNTSVYTIEYLYGWACGGTNSYANLLNGPIPSNYHVTFDSVSPGCWYLQAYSTGDTEVFNSVALTFTAGQTFTWTLN